MAEPQSPPTATQSAQTKPVEAHVETQVEGKLGIITLNRPRAINALNREMIAAIRTQLAAWRGDDAVRAVLFEGRGDKGFCAGGDVRAAREAVVGGRPQDADAFFSEEYAMNGEIANYEKPVIVICDGIVMGGGIGIAGHADFRFATPTVKYAMPEAAIGFVSDVGVNAILARAPLHRALLFLMTGNSVGAGDARALGLTDCVVKAHHLPDLRIQIRGACDAAEVDTAIVALMQAETIEPEDAKLCADADRLAEGFEGETAAEIVAGIEELEDGSPVYGPILRARSPTSLEAIVISHRAARRRLDIDAVLGLDRKFSAFMARQPDFAEGVRAVLVDKDNAPKWTPAEFSGVRADMLRALTAG
jgi:enoyl-CoA hydratase